MTRITTHETGDEILLDKFIMNVDEYLEKVQNWDKKTYDAPFDDGYLQARVQILSLPILSTPKPKGDE